MRHLIWDAVVGVLDCVIRGLSRLRNIAAVNAVPPRPHFLVSPDGIVQRPPDVPVYFAGGCRCAESAGLPFGECSNCGKYIA